MNRLLYATDFHGAQDALEALFQRAKEDKPDLIILGGDLAPMPGQDIDASPAEQREFYLNYFAEILQRWRDSRGCPVWAIPGNDDWASTFESSILNLQDKGLIGSLLHQDVCLGNWVIMGFPWVPVTPFFMSDYDRIDYTGWEPQIYPEWTAFSNKISDSIVQGSWSEFLNRPTIAEELEELTRHTDKSRLVLVAHTPPWGCGLDLMGNGAFVGSEALTQWITRHQPALTLHGHIHEAPWVSGTMTANIDRTLSINPGASCWGLRAVTLESDNSGQWKIVRGID
ncbi:metallophosphoesterase family protein [Magnetococcus sp. PR-3]|uniref:metallophosphoesterase family protein n=1 Tax=Magnetococcus sp. PR-3 TaxID=3120355 RepID=UPI002FCE466A